jgi:hypothetical protein
MVTPYSIMADGVIKEDAAKANASIIEVDWTKRVTTLDQGPRPNYYGGKDNPYEVFRVLEAWELDEDFYLGNVIKYLARAGKKNKSTKKEDLQKALVYLQRRIDNLE